MDLCEYINQSFVVRLRMFIWQQQSDSHDFNAASVKQSRRRICCSFLISKLTLLVQTVCQKMFYHRLPAPPSSSSLSLKQTVSQVKTLWMFRQLCITFVKPRLNGGATGGAQGFLSRPHRCNKAVSNSRDKPAFSDRGSFFRGQNTWLENQTPSGGEARF